MEKLREDIAAIMWDFRNKAKVHGSAYYWVDQIISLIQPYIEQARIDGLVEAYEDILEQIKCGQPEEVIEANIKNSLSYQIRR